MKTMPIERLVRWAYRDELPKVPIVGGSFLPTAPTHLGVASGWQAVSEFGQLLAVVDTNAFGIVPDRGAGDDVHPDALAVARAVAGLGDLELGFPDDWAPLGDLGDLGEAGTRATAAALDRVSVVGRDGVRRLRHRAACALVHRHAILGDRPDWECEVPEVKFVRGLDGRGAPRWFVMRREAIGEDAFGQPIFGDVERDGYDAKRKRAYPDAYRKTYLDPDPTDAAVARAEYEIWRAALGLLVEDLAEGLVDHVVTPPDSPARPWEEPAKVAARILPDLTAKAPVARVLSRRKRPLAA